MQSLLTDPNTDSPANVDAAKVRGPTPVRAPSARADAPLQLYKEDKKAYRRMVRRCAERSLEM